MAPVTLFDASLLTPESRNAALFLSVRLKPLPVAFIDSLLCVSCLGHAEELRVLTANRPCSRQIFVAEQQMPYLRSWHEQENIGSNRTFCYVEIRMTIVGP